MVTRSSKKKAGIIKRGNVCTPEESLKLAKMQIREAMPAVIGAFIAEAKRGSCQHAKFLMEFAVEEPAEVKGPAGETTDPEEESLASILLRELRESEAEESV